MPVVDLKLRFVATIFLLLLGATMFSIEESIPTLALAETCECAPDQVCCGGTCIDPSTTGCCNGEPYDLSEYCCH